MRGFSFVHIFHVRFYQSIENVMNVQLDFHPENSFAQRTLKPPVTLPKGYLAL